MVSPEKVTLSVESVTSTDQEGNDVTETSTVTVWALVAPGDTSDLGGMEHADGDVADVTLYASSRALPTSLRGAHTTISRWPGRRFLVMGDPLPYQRGWATRRFDTVIRCREEVG